MTVLNLFRAQSRSKTVLTSRPIFLHSSSFVDDEEEQFEKPVLPLFHRGSHRTDSEMQRALAPSARLSVILHALNSIFTLTSICLFVATIPMWNANFRHAKSPIAGDYTDGIVLAPLFMSLFISVYILATEHTPLRNYLRPQFGTISNSAKSSSGIFVMRPKTLILASFTVLLTLAPALTVSATNSLALAWRDAQHNKTGLILCDLSNMFSRQCQPLLYQIGGLQIGAVTTGALAWSVWVVLLVVAIRWWGREHNEKERVARERRRRRQEERKQRRVHRHGRRHHHHHQSREKHGVTTEGEVSRPEPIATPSYAYAAYGNNVTANTSTSSLLPSYYQTSPFTQPSPAPAPAPQQQQQQPWQQQHQQQQRGSSAAQLAAYNVRQQPPPRGETMQQWLMNGGGRQQQQQRRSQNRS